MAVYERTHYERRYVWEAPVRLWHWSHFFAMIALFVTGYYIGAPFVSPAAAWHYAQEGIYVMSAMRFIHFVAAAVVTLAVIVRIYWFLVGNKYSHWRAWLPMTNRREFTDWVWRLKEQVLFYIFLRRRAPEWLGDNPLASLSYLGTIVLLVLQVLTGWALYGEVNHFSLAWRLYGWVFNFARRQDLRYVHHAIMWLLVAFFVVHLYMAIRDEVLGNTGTMTSIVGGYKYDPVEHRSE